MTKEQKFYNKLRDIFIGAKVEGQGGFINLMKVKSKYYEKIEPLLKEDIENALQKYSNFRDELFDKLYTFFNRYFTENGSIYFNSTPFHNNVYEKVYTDDRDVILFWKTRMLYYVKTDRIFKSMPVEFDGNKFYFDVSTVENKKVNEKRELIYELKEIKTDNTIVFNVIYSEKGRVTKTDEILKKIKKKGLKDITEKDLERAFKIFEKQSEIDYFINKNAKEFLKEQFNLWLYQYLTNPDTEWTHERIEQIQILKRVAYKLIDFVSQFENELVKIWNKPKFVRNSNYVISLDRIVGKGGWHIIDKLSKHDGWQEQVKEWIELGIIEKEPESFIEENLTEKKLKKDYQFLAIDTKYFKDIEIEILELFDNLDDELDGWLIKSENYQALNTILPKFRGKVKTIYIDPPYNTGNDEFIYKDKFKHSSWLTMMENRLQLAREFLTDDGVIFVSIGDTLRKNEKINSTHLLNLVMSDIFGNENYIATLVRKTGTSPRHDAAFIATSHDYVLCFSKNIDKVSFNRKTTNSIFEFKDKYSYKRGKFRLNKLDRGSKKYSSKLDYPIRIKKGEFIEIFDGLNFSIIPSPEDFEMYPNDDQNDTRWTWTWSEKKVKWGIENGFIVFRKIGNKWRVYHKEYEFVDNNDKSKIRNLPYDSFILDCFNEKGTSEIENLFNKRIFEYAKPSCLVEYLLNLTPFENNDIVLDFYAGSGTTLSAIINLNKKIGKKLKFIIIEVDDIFYKSIVPRLKKISYSEKWKNGKSLIGNGYPIFCLYYELESYENVLSKIKYSSDKEFGIDKKLSFMVDIEFNKNKVELNLVSLYKDVDIYQSISNILGKKIKKIKENYAVLENDLIICMKEKKQNLLKLIKPFIWWE